MKILTKLKNLRESEPVRTTVYPVLVAGLLVLVGTGKLSSDTSDLIVTVIGLALGITAAEKARAKVTPAGKAAEVVVDVVEQVQDVAAANPQVQAAIERARAFALGLGKHRRPRV